MTVRCPGCSLSVTIHVAPTFGQDANVTDVMCIGCELYFDATPGPNLGQPLPVCEGFEVPPTLRVVEGSGAALRSRRSKRRTLHVVREEGT